MRKEIIFSMESPYRDTFRIWGYRFGIGEKTLAIVGAMRGDEVHQQFVCAQLVSKLESMERDGMIAPGQEILVIPSANPFSMNVEKRFWALDGTDINRMFPGYDLGETTQRIASGVFEAIKDYKYGIQLASSYQTGEFMPHVRLLKTGFEDVETAKLFGLPYVYVRAPKPFDTTTLNYNWQIWDTKACSIYAGKNNDVSPEACQVPVNAIMRFIVNVGIANFASGANRPSFNTIVLDDQDLVTINSPAAGIFQNLCSPGHEVSKGEIIARIIDPYDGSVRSEIASPCDGVVFHLLGKPLTLLHTPIFMIRKYQ